MRWHYILFTVGALTLFFGATMLVPLAVGLLAGDDSPLAVVKAMVLTLAFGAVLMAVFKKSKAETISQREGMAIVAIGWTAIGVFGALPFYFSAPGFVFVDAFFESVSGFTTTGSSILTDI